MRIQISPWCKSYLFSCYMKEKVNLANFRSPKPIAILHTTQNFNHEPFLNTFSGWINIIASHAWIAKMHYYHYMVLLPQLHVLYCIVNSCTRAIWCKILRLHANMFLLLCRNRHSCNSKKVGSNKKFNLCLQLCGGDSQSWQEMEGFIV